MPADPALPWPCPGLFRLEVLQRYHTPSPHLANLDPLSTLLPLHCHSAPEYGHGGDLELAL